MTYDLLNTGYVIAGRNTPLPSKFNRIFDGGGGISVYRNNNAFPRAWVAYATSIANDQSQSLDRIKESDFDPRATLILSVSISRETYIEFVPH